MHLCILIIGLVLFPQVYTLNCFTCENTLPCSDKQCPAEKNKCGTKRVIKYNGNALISDSISKSCYTTQECLRGFLNFGVEKRSYTIECCSSNLCNNKDVPDPPKTKPNGKKCYRCDGNGGCSGTLNCEGDEDHCVKVTETAEGKSKTKKGCATKSACSAKSLIILGINGTLSCCEGNYCNGVNGLSASLLVLAAMQMSVFFLSP